MCSSTVRFGRDHTNGPPVVEFRPEPVGVEGLVAQEHVEFHALDQRLYPNQIVGLPRQAARGQDQAGQDPRQKDLRIPMERSEQDLNCVDRRSTRDLLT